MFEAPEKARRLPFVATSSLDASLTAELNKTDPVTHLFEIPKEPRVLIPYLRSQVAKLPFRFDLNRLRQTSQEVMREHELRHKSTYDHYLGIGLQSNPGVDEFYETMEDQRDISNKHPGVHFTWDKINSLGEKFQFVFDRFREHGIHLYRARLLMCEPGHLHRPHFDWDMRIHIPIFTNPQARAIFWNRSYLMEADGSAYFHNGYSLHTFGNSGTTPRLTFIACVKGLSNLHAKVGKVLTRADYLKRRAR